MRRAWDPIIDTARTIVDEYDYLITLRQLHYRLVMTPGLGYVNTEGDYKRLSSLTAEGRRDGTFPDLLDQTRAIVGGEGFSSPADALRWLATIYTRRRDEGQDWLVVLGGEKATLLAQLNDWFGGLGARIVLLRGYGSQTYADDVAEMATHDGRPTVLVYAGDFDPSGEDILRDFLERCPVFDKVERVAVNPDQLRRLDLVVNPGKPEDARAGAFVAKYADLHAVHDFGHDRNGRRVPVQVEVEAIPPDVLRSLYDDALDRYWDTSICDAMIARERVERDRLADLFTEWNDE